MASSPVLTLLERSQAAVMGIINTTPDSFSDGGLFAQATAAIEHGLRLVEQGADMLDVGGESTRPGADPVSVEQELDRVLPVIEGLRARTPVPISIDTSKAPVMQAAVAAGASFINDVTALQGRDALSIACAAQVPICLMHMQGAPTTMQAQPQYQSVVDEVIAFLQTRIRDCEAQGIARATICVDPGIGFGKTLEHNLQLLGALPYMRAQLGCALLVGVSRKSMIGAILGRDVHERLYGSLGLAVQSVLNGAKIVRVHDVQATVEAIRCVEAVQFAAR